MQESPAKTASWPLAMLLAALGALLALVGAFTSWFTTSVFHETEIFGSERVASVSAPGTHDWTGVVAMAVGLIVGLLAIVGLLFTDPGVRRIAATFAFVGGLLLVALALVAFVRAGSVAGGLDVGRVNGPDQLRRESGASFGIILAGLGGALAALGGLAARRMSER